MTQVKDSELDTLHKKVEATRARVFQADEHIKTLGEGAQKVGLSITGATLEMNALMKDLFLCAEHQLPEYEILQGELMRHLENIALIANTRFGKEKPLVSKNSKETH